MELRVADIATKSDNLRYPYESNGVKAVAAPIQLETGNSFKGTLHYTAEFIPCLALKNIKFETQTSEKDRVASQYDNAHDSMLEDDVPPVPSKLEQSTPAPNAHPIDATNDAPVDAATDVKPNETGELNGVADKKAETNGVADKKTEADGVDLSHEELLAQRE